MADQPGPTGRRTSLTKKQLETELGAELLSLCQSVTADGVLSESEISDLRSWIAEHSAEDLPAIAHLRQVLEQVLADGKISPEEFAQVHLALEAVLPAELRREARAARRGREQEERAAVQAGRAEARQKARDERERNSSIGTANFMVAGVRHEGRPAIIARHVRPDEPAVLRRDRANRFSANAVTVHTSGGHQVGFVPEDVAEYWAPIMDDGAQVRARFTKVLGSARAPIPVVNARFYGRDATLEAEPSGARRAAAADGGSTATRQRQPIPSSLKWLAIVIVALIVLALLV
jgi:hypothetical protein